MPTKIPIHVSNYKAYIWDVKGIYNEYFMIYAHLIVSLRMQTLRYCVQSIEFVVFWQEHYLTYPSKISSLASL